MHHQSLLASSGAASVAEAMGRRTEHTRCLPGGTSYCLGCKHRYGGACLGRLAVPAKPIPPSCACLPAGSLLLAGASTGLTADTAASTRGSAMPPVLSGSACRSAGLCASLPVAARAQSMRPRAALAVLTPAHCTCAGANLLPLVPRLRRAHWERCMAAMCIAAEATGALQGPRCACSDRRCSGLAGSLCKSMPAQGWPCLLFPGSPAHWRSLEPLSHFPLQPCLRWCPPRLPSPADESVHDAKAHCLLALHLLGVPLPSSGEHWRADSKPEASRRQPAHTALSCCQQRAPASEHLLLHFLLQRSFGRGRRRSSTGGPGRGCGGPYPPAPALRPMRTLCSGGLRTLKAAPMLGWRAQPLR